MAAEVLPVVKTHAGARRRERHRPVPQAWTSSSMRSKRLGFSGVQNFPTVGLIDGTFRANLEETGMGYGLEVDMIAAGHTPRTCSPRRTSSARTTPGRWPRPAPTSSSAISG
jgi:predicted TIM-barrel enzyme